MREALGRALFGAQRYESAAAEFEAVTEMSPTDDYALFCLGRTMQLLGRHREACRALSLASLDAARAGRLSALSGTRPGHLETA